MNTEKDHVYEHKNEFIDHTLVPIINSIRSMVQFMLNLIIGYLKAEDFGSIW